MENNNKIEIPFARILCDGNELKYVKEVLDSGWITTAKKVSEFENRFTELLNVKYAFAVNSGTAALHLAADAAGINHESRVFVPSMTFTASAEVLRYLGATPIFLDVDYDTLLVTPEILEEAVVKYPDVKHIMLVHYAGQMSEMIGNGSPKGISEICLQNGIKIIEDAAHAFPASIENVFPGNLSVAGCLSFYANKPITTAEGGMLLTNDDKIAERVKVMRLHGINRDIWNRYTSNKPSWEYDVIEAGYKYNMSDVNAAIGLAQLERAYEMRDERERCAQFYYDNLGEVDCIDLPVARSMKEHAWHIFAIKLNEKAKVSRNDFIEILAQKGIGTSVHYKPLHQLMYYKQKYGLKPEDFPVSEKVWQSCVSLPIYPSLTNDELSYVCDVIKNVLK